MKIQFHSTVWIGLPLLLLFSTAAADRNYTKPGSKYDCKNCPMRFLVNSNAH